MRGRGPGVSTCSSVALGRPDRALSTKGTALTKEPRLAVWAAGAGKLARNEDHDSRWATNHCKAELQSDRWVSATRVHVRGAHSPAWGNRGFAVSVECVPLPQNRRSREGAAAAKGRVTCLHLHGRAASGPGASSVGLFYELRAAVDDLRKVLGAWFPLHVHRPGGRPRAGTAPCPQPSSASAPLPRLRAATGLRLGFPLWHTWVTRVATSLQSE